MGAFKCDATPPAGEPLLWATNLVHVETPLLAKGIVLDNGSSRYVLCALDWCLLANESEWAFRQSLAAAVKTEPENVAVHCVHQHAAPYADEGAHRWLARAPRALTHLSDHFLDTLRRRLADAASEALAQSKPFNQVGSGEARVDRVASARRLRGADGKISVRYSTSGKDPQMAAAPEGDIDPMLKTVTFARDGVPLARLHYYATHPQTFCCDGRASADFVGEAREAQEAEEHVFQVYFTGCAGDVTVGKYNDTSPGVLHDLAVRLQAGMRASIAQTKFVPAQDVVWRRQAVVLPLRGEEAAVVSQSRAWLEDPTQGDGMRAYEGAMRLAFVDRLSRPIELSSLQLGPVWIVHLPGEPMLEFQRYAQRCRPSQFVAVAGYGDCAPAYICTDQALVEGGYEPSAANVGKGSEAVLKDAIRRLLGLSSSAQRERILTSMQAVMGPLPSHWRDLPLEMKIEQETVMPRFTRRKLTYRTAPGDRVAAWLLIPRDRQGPAPAMLCLHQTVDIGKDEPVGLGGNADLRYGLELAERGYVTLMPDYWPLGDYRGGAYSPYQQGFQSATMKGLWTHIRSLDLLAAMPEVDARRLGCIGHSLGGHNALWLAAFDPRVKVVVSSCGFSSFRSYATSPYGGGSLKNWAGERYMPRIASEYGNDHARMPFDWPDVLAAIAPARVFVNAPLKDENFLVGGARECLEAAAPVFQELGVPDHLQAVHPDAAHSFPPDARKAAYGFIDRAMREANAAADGDAL